MTEGEGRAEERHEAVAEQLIDGALVAVDLGKDQLEGAVHQAVDVLRVAAVDQGGEAGDVNEEDSHDLALPSSSVITTV